MAEKFPEKKLMKLCSTPIGTDFDSNT